MQDLVVIEAWQAATQRVSNYLERSRTYAFRVSILLSFFYLADYFLADKEIPDFGKVELWVVTWLAHYLLVPLSEEKPRFALLSMLFLYALVCIKLPSSAIIWGLIVAFVLGKGFVQSWMAIHTARSMVPSTSPSP